ncbi:MAG: tyrosine-protein phosphatase [Tannerellaceae bacterium]|jgi:protein-tyrosine phosphatase|nr:tyrosine-protein phosphatase [Tannerellaceae bacterium]
MATKAWIISTGILFLTTGCASQMPEIYSLCQRDGIGNYIIKWETHPELDGEMKLYVSDNPDMSQASPAGYTPIHNGVMTYITNDNISRKYFRLLFDNTYEQTTASRLVMMDSVQNLRDIGGYLSSQGKFMRWGKVYRSGEIGRISAWDTLRLNKLKIKTIIDLRSMPEVMRSPIGYSKAKIVHIPIDSDMSDIVGQIRKGKVRKGDGSLFMQDLYLRYVTENRKEFAQALNLFLDEDNYPILFNCSLGKDRAGFLAALLLAALDMPEETILSDYVVTNDYLNLTRYANLVQELDSDAQEALTVILSANETFLNLALRKIKKEYGSMDKYLSEELQLTDKQKEKLKEMLLF